MARRNRYTNRRGVALIVLLVIAIGMILLGMGLMTFVIDDYTAEDVSDTSLYKAAVVTESGIHLTSALLPIFIWLGVAGVLVVALVFVYKGFMQRRRR